MIQPGGCCSVEVKLLENGVCGKHSQRDSTAVMKDCDNADSDNRAAATNST
jgi:hypothetical protein